MDKKDYFLNAAFVFLFILIIPLSGAGEVYTREECDRLGLTGVLCDSDGNGMEDGICVNNLESGGIYCKSSGVAVYADAVYDACGLLTNKGLACKQDISDFLRGGNMIDGACVDVGGYLDCVSFENNDSDCNAYLSGSATNKKAEFFVDDEVRVTDVCDQTLWGGKWWHNSESLEFNPNIGKDSAFPVKHGQQLKIELVNTDDNHQAIFPALYLHLPGGAAKSLFSRVYQVALGSDKFEKGGDGGPVEHSSEYVIGTFRETIINISLPEEFRGKCGVVDECEEIECTDSDEINGNGNNPEEQGVTEGEGMICGAGWAELTGHAVESGGKKCEKGIRAHEDYCVKKLANGEFEKNSDGGYRVYDEIKTSDLEDGEAAYFVEGRCKNEKDIEIIGPQPCQPEGVVGCSNGICEGACEKIEGDDNAENKIVFVGADFDSEEEMRRSFEDIIYNGFKKIEPFKSFVDGFQFWHVKKQVKTKPIKSIKELTGFINTAKKYSSGCGKVDKTILIGNKIVGGSFASLAVGLVPKLGENNMYAINNIAIIFHELGHTYALGHSFGGLPSYSLALNCDTRRQDLKVLNRGDELLCSWSDVMKPSCYYGCDDSAKYNRQTRASMMSYDADMVFSSFATPDFTLDKKRPVKYNVVECAAILEQLNIGNSRGWCKNNVDILGSDNSECKENKDCFSIYGDCAKQCNPETRKCDFKKDNEPCLFARLKIGGCNVQGVCLYKKNIQCQSDGTKEIDCGELRGWDGGCVASCSDNICVRKGYGGACFKPGENPPGGRCGSGSNEGKCSERDAGVQCLVPIDCSISLKWDIGEKGCTLSCENNQCVPKPKGSACEKNSERGECGGFFNKGKCIV